MVTQVSHSTQHSDDADDSVDVDEIFRKAQKYKKELNLELSLKYFFEVLSLNPQHGWAHHCIAQTYHWCGQLDKSVEHYNQAIDCLPFKTSAVSLQQLAFVYKAQNKRYHAYIAINEASIRHADYEQYENDRNILLSEVAKSIEYLFDVEYYTNKIAEFSDVGEKLRSKKECSEHYVKSGWKDFPAGNWLFSASYIERQLKNSDTNIPLLVKYSDAITNGLSISPSPLFDAGLVKDTLKDNTISVHLENVIEGINSDFKYSYLFDPDYYRSQINSVSDEWALCGKNPYKHYLLYGYQTNLNPHRLFNTKYYRSQHVVKQNNEEMKDNENLLYYYFNQSANENESPCPAIVNKYYRIQNPQIMGDELNDPILVHFLKSTNRNCSIPRFNSDFYLESNSDIHNQCPHKHFAEYGVYEKERVPFRGFSKNFIYNRSPVKEYKNETPAFKYYLSELYENETILLVSHSGSRTGAPLIILKIAKELCKIKKLNLITVVLGGGELVDEFARYSHVITTKNNFGGDRIENRKLHAEIVKNDISMIIANSAESRTFIDSNSFSDIPTFLLVHEIADHYPQSSWDNLFKISNHIVFPSEYVAQKSKDKLIGTNTNDTHDKTTSVIPQGLLTDNFGHSNYLENRIKKRKELGIPENAVVVLGCGLKNFRKGVDLFYDTATQVISTTDNMYFLWVGSDSQQSDNDNILYWKEKVTPKSILKNIKFVDAVANTEAYFQTADIFLLSSRSDPFPCVVHEAMSCKLPIVYMKNSTGSEELIGTDYGIPVEYENIDQLSEAVKELSSNASQTNAIGEAARNHVSKHSKYEDYVYRLINCFCEDEDVSEKTEKILKKYNDYREKSENVSVYFLSPDWGLSGVNSISEVLINELIQQGYDAKVLFTRHQLDFSNSENVFMPQVPYKFMNTISDKDFPENVWDSLIEYFSEHDPCIVIFNYDYISSSISALFPKHVALIGVAHSDDAEHYEHVNRVGRYWNHIVGVSDEITKNITTMNLSLDRVSSIRNGIAEYDTKITNLDKNKRKSGELINLVYSGRIVDMQKKVIRYIELASELEKRNIKFHLTMLGDGSELETLKTEIVDRGLVDKVSLPGRVTNEKSIKCFKEADVFLLLSDFEGLPISLLESLREGCIPIVYSMNSGVNDVIEHGINGYVCESNNILMVADYVEIVFNCDNNDEMILNCQNSLKINGLTSLDMSKKYSEIFEKCMSEIKDNIYKRPESLEHGYWYKGAMPPAWVKKESV